VARLKAGKVAGKTVVVGEHAEGCDGEGRRGRTENIAEVRAEEVTATGTIEVVGKKHVCRSRPK
jgi:hypothetical protein